LQLAVYALHVNFEIAGHFRSLTFVAVLIDNPFTIPKCSGILYKFLGTPLNEEASRVTVA
jgi:hypothetical protein